jgi:hypothetical protein
MPSGRVPIIKTIGPLWVFATSIFTAHALLMGHYSCPPELAKSEDVDKRRMDAGFNIPNEITVGKASNLCTKS